MKAFLYGVGLQLKLDIRSKTLLITCYIVPLLFFALMGGIFTSVDPNSRATLICSMTVFVATMGAVIGVPPSIAEIYGGGVRKVYKANGVPVASGVATVFISAFIHLTIAYAVFFAIAPIAFKAELPPNLASYFGILLLIIAVSLSIGCALGVSCTSQSKLTMISQLVFLPSIMLSGLMFPAQLLPSFLRYVGYAFPASIAYQAMTAFRIWHVFALLGVMAVMFTLVAIRLKKLTDR